MASKNAPAPDIESKKPDDAPQWLTDEQPRPAANAPGAAQGRKGIAVIDNKLPPLPRLVLVMRIANMVICILIATVAIIKMIAVTSVSAGVISVYLVFFSCMVTCFELQLKVLMDIIGTNFGFLYNGKGRAIFFLFIAFLTFTLGLFGYILGSIMVLNGFFNLYVIWKFPQYEEMAFQGMEQEAKAYAERQTQQLIKNNPHLVAETLGKAASAGRSAV